MRSFKMEVLKDIITDLMQGLKSKKRPQDDPASFLAAALPKKELPHVKFRYLRKGILGITVDSSSRLYHLNLKKQALLARIEKRSAAVKDIRFYLGEMS